MTIIAHPFIRPLLAEHTPAVWSGTGLDYSLNPDVVAAAVQAGGHPVDPYDTSGASPPTDADLSPNGRAALDYAARGWHVFPVKPAAGDPHARPGSPEHLAYKASKGPHPTARRTVGEGADRPGKVLKAKDAATSDPGVIRRWWSVTPDARIGVNLAASGLVAVDDDSYKPADDQRQELRALPVGLPETLTSLSPSGGTHRLYRAPVNAATRNYRDGEVLWNRYIVLPSPGSGYQWLDSSAEAAELPEHVAAVLFGPVREDAPRDFPLPDDEELAQRQAELVWYLDSLGLEYRLRDRHDGQAVAELVECPFDSHAEPYKAVLGRGSGGGWWVKCVKHGCGGENGASRWPDFRERYEQFPVPTFLDVADQLGWNRLGVGCWVPATDLGLAEGRDVFVLAESAEALDAELVPIKQAGSLSRLKRLADVEERPVEWLWQRRIPLGKVTILAGDPSAGKTFIALGVAAAVTTGTPLPGDDTAREPGSVIFVSFEDAAEDTLKPRARRMGADLDRLFVMDSEQLLTAGDILELEPAIEAVGDVRLIVIDPLGSYIGGKTDTGKDNAVREALRDTVRLAERYNVAVLVLAHLNKGDSKSLYRINGSIGFVGLVRTTLIAGTHDGKKGLAGDKNNLSRGAETWEYRIEDEDGPGTDTGMLVWADPMPGVTPDMLLQAPRQRPAGESKLDRAAAWLETALADGPRPQKELESEAGQEGIASGTLREAKVKLDIKSRRPGGSGGWLWEWDGFSPIDRGAA